MPPVEPVQPDLTPDLHTLAALESGNRITLVDRIVNGSRDRAAGLYHLTNFRLRDELARGTIVDPEATQSATTDDTMFKWMKRNADKVDKLAESIYTTQVIPRYGRGMVSLLGWYAPNAADAGMRQYGYTAAQLEAEPLKQLQVLNAASEWAIKRAEKTNDPTDLRRARDINNRVVNIQRLHRQSWEVPGVPAASGETNLNDYDPTADLVRANRRENWYARAADSLGHGVANAVASLQQSLGLRDPAFIDQAPEDALKTAASTVWNDFEKVGKAYEKLSGLGRGVLAMRPGEELTTEQLTGLASEQLTDQQIEEVLTAPALGLVYAPKAAINQAVELATDPATLVMGLGGVGWSAAKTMLSTISGGEMPVARLLGRTPPIPPPVAQKSPIAPVYSKEGDVVKIGEFGEKTPPATPPPITAYRGTAKGNDPLSRALGRAPETAQDMKSLIDGFRAELDSHRTTDEALYEAGKKLLEDKTVTTFTMLTDRLNTLPPKEKLMAYNLIRNAAGKRFDALVGQYEDLLKGGLPREPGAINLAKDEAAKQFKLLLKLSEPVRGAEVELASSLRAAKSGQGKVLESFDTMLGSSESRGIDSLTGFDDFLRQYGLLTSQNEKMDMLREASKWGKISGTATQISLNTLIAAAGVPFWNFISGIGLTVKYAAERQMARAGQGVLAIAPNEGAAMLWNTMSAMGRLAIKDAQMTELVAGKKAAYWESVKGQLDGDAAARFQVRRSIDPEVYGMNPDGPAGKFVKGLGHTVNLPSYAVGMSDVILRSIVETAEVETMAYRKAFFDVVTDPATVSLSNSERKALLLAKRDEILANPDKHTVQVWDRQTQQPKYVTLTEAGTRWGDIATMMDKPTGGVAAVEKMFNESFWGRQVVPFFRPLYVNTRELVSTIPGLHKLVPSMVQDLAAGGERAAMAEARLRLGYGLIFAGGVAMESGLIDGDGPRDPKQHQIWRDAGHVERTINVGGARVPLDKLGPAGQVLGFAATVLYHAHRIDNLDMATEALLAVTAAVAKLMEHPAFYGDMRRLMGFIYGDDKKGLEAWLEKRAGAAVNPKLVTQLADYIDGHKRSPDGILQRMQMTGFFGGRDDLAIYRDYWGNEDEVPQEAWGMVGGLVGIVKDKSVDPRQRAIADQIIKDNLSPAYPAQRRGPDQAVELSKKEWMDFVQYARKDFRNPANRKDFTTELYDQMNDPKGFYQHAATIGPHSSRQHVLTHIESHWDSAAFASFIGQRDPAGRFVHSDLRARFEQAKAYYNQLDRGVSVTPGSTPSISGGQ